MAYMSRRLILRHRELLPSLSTRPSFKLLPSILSRRLTVAASEQLTSNDADYIPKPPSPFHEPNSGNSQSLPVDIKSNGPSLAKKRSLNLIEPITGLHPIFLRDACACPRCRDPSSKQKLFQTSDIPANVEPHSVRSLENGDVEMRWKHDIPGFGPDHISIFSKTFLDTRQDLTSLRQSTRELAFRSYWNAAEIERNLGALEYDDYMNDDQILYKGLYYLNVHGLLIVKGVPESEKAVENIGNRIGTLRDTFYGRTWDVQSIPEAKNVAYTHQYLGLHMDLLYMANPPGIQLLHCLKNTCQGGTSLFSDSFRAARSLSPDDFKTLSKSAYEIPYHYNNDGHHYRFQHRVIESEKPSGNRERGKVTYINYSPPFQEPFQMTKTSNPYWLSQFLPALKRFAKLVEMPQNLFQYRLKEGECVVFNNRRILHGRTAFDAEGGERWLKGAYVDSDVFNSRWRVLDERYQKTVEQLLNSESNSWKRKAHRSSTHHVPLDNYHSL